MGHVDVQQNLHTGVEVRAEPGKTGVEQCIVFGRL